VGAARNLEKAAKATDALKREFADRFCLVELDLASLGSVQACADNFNAEKKPFHYVIANAGIMATPFGRTADGFESQFATNHLGHFVLTNRIADLMPSGGRLIVLSFLQLTTLVTST
jgi:NAD(P)-dependent dehydrogenase (short-subunit alcohol dehydrogenase family)